MSDYFSQMMTWITAENLTWIGLGALLLWIFPMTRFIPETVWAILKSMVSGVSTSMILNFGRGMIWMLKKVYSAHQVYLRNLLLPRSKIFPTLEKDERKN